ERMVREIFRHTTTIGIREAKLDRYVLERNVTEHQTAYGILRKKDVSGYGVQRCKWEYDDIALVASEQGTDLREIVRQLNNREG
ncbi:MAG: LarC family nickel insertion protein, partial [Lachnospiraceae bacterium]|nr:LarC family nickel insertion protein [Lachnospiraceae bacterium]